MKITLGKDQVSMMNPPNEGEVVEGNKTWQIKHGQYGITLKSGIECHPDFTNGMDLGAFCWWINSQLQ